MVAWEDCKGGRPQVAPTNLRRDLSATRQRASIARHYKFTTDILAFPVFRWELRSLNASLRLLR